MNISAALVKELRERTNAGMMECKKALIEAEGDIEKAIEAMRKAGQAKAVKKASRTTREGTIMVLNSDDTKSAVLVEINCETDFVAREEKFKEFARKIAMQALQNKVKNVEELQKTTDQARLDLIAQLGENVTVRRIALQEAKEGFVGSYAHGDANGTRIGVLVGLKGGTQELARDIAMHIAGMNPEYLNAQDIPQARLDKEKEILMAQTLEQLQKEGKSPDMLEKIVAGKVKKFTTDNSLMSQAFVKDPAKTIESLLKEKNATVQNFVRFELGEGIEKKEDNFVEEVMAQIHGE